MALMAFCVREEEGREQRVGSSRLGGGGRRSWLSAPRRGEGVRGDSKRWGRQAAGGGISSQLGVIRCPPPPQTLGDMADPRVPRCPRPPLAAARHPTCRPGVSMPPRDMACTVTPLPASSSARPPTMHSSLAFSAGAAAGGRGMVWAREGVWRQQQGPAPRAGVGNTCSGGRRSARLAAVGHSRRVARQPEAAAGWWCLHVRAVNQPAAVGEGWTVVVPPLAGTKT